MRLTMTKAILAGAITLSLASASARSSASAPNPAVQLKRSCVKCHNLAVVRAQHLSREEWQRELDKMTVMGAKVDNREVLLDYLTRMYGPESAKRARK
jgi:hypothetical protein